MEKKKTILHENAPDKSRAALLLIDVISDFEFEDGAALFKQTFPKAESIAKLKERAKGAKIPVIYINDNFGKWRDDFQKTIKHCLRKTVRGSKIVKLLKPAEDDYFVLKPKHSAFYSTTLDLLLQELGVKTIVIAGISTDICVLFSANDAYMRGYQLFIPQDCVASVKPEENKRALEYIERVLKADVRASAEIDFAALLGNQAE